MQTAADGQMPLNKIIENVLAAAFEEGLVSDATIAANGNQRAALVIRELTPESEIKAGPAYKSDISIPLEHMSAFYHRAADAAQAVPRGCVFSALVISVTATCTTILHS